MPISGWHTSRQQDPEKYKKIRTSKNEFGSGINTLYGVTEDGKTEVQSIHFDASKFTPEEAKAWLRKHNYKDNLEPATGGKSALNELVKKLSAYKFI